MECESKVGLQACLWCLGASLAASVEAALRVPAVAVPPAFAHSSCRAFCSQVGRAAQHGAVIVR